MRARILTDMDTPPTQRTARTAGRVYAKTETTRRRIMEAATQLFAERGFAAGTVAEIAERAGISEPQVYYHFESKQALLLHVLAERDRLADETAGPDPDDSSEIPAAILRIAAGNRSVPDFIRLYMVLFAEATSTDHVAHPYFFERYRRLRGRFIEVFTRLYEDGHLRPGIDPDYAATSTLAMWDGIQLQWLLEPAAVSVDHLLERHLRALTVGPAAPS